MRIKVTDLETGSVSVYELSKDNWRKAWACMSDGGVVMWVPAELTISPGSAVRTSGRRWEVLK